MVLSALSSAVILRGVSGRAQSPVNLAESLKV
jgi:hypothetical protein